MNNGRRTRQRDVTISSASYCMKVHRLIWLTAQVWGLSVATQAQFLYTVNYPATNTITIYGYTGGGGAVNIPDLIDGKTVTQIQDNAFAANATMTSVSIPASVSHIGLKAFFANSRLTHIAVANDNGAYSSSQGVLFNKAQTVLIQFPGGLATHYSIPNGVTTIGDFSFDFCTSLKGVTIPNSLTQAGSTGFIGCSGMTNVIFGTGLTFLGNQMFQGCSSLVDIAVPNGITNIGSSAFSGCSGMTNITISDSVARIGQYSFQSCTKLTTATIGANVSNIDQKAFASCTKLAQAYFSGNAPAFGADIFSGCSNATVYYKSGTTGWPAVPNPWAGRPTALWLTPFIVTYDAQGGTVSPSSVTVTNGMPYGVLPTPTRAGYAFDGWWTGAAGSGAQVTSQSIVTNTTAHSLYAKWLVALLEISPTSTNYSSSSTSGSVEVTANVPWTSSSNVSWIVVAGGASGMTNGMVIFNVATNPGIFARTGSVVVSGAGMSKTCLVTQAGAAATLAITPTSTNFTSAAASGRITRMACGEPLTDRLGNSTAFCGERCNTSLARSSPRAARSDCSYSGSCA